MVSNTKMSFIILHIIEDLGRNRHLCIHKIISLLPVYRFIDMVGAAFNLFYN